MERVNLEAFLDTHNLTLELEEVPNRWIARIVGGEILELTGGLGLLKGATGFGPTKRLALNALLSSLSNRALVLKAYTAYRREIQVPMLVIDSRTLTQVEEA